MDIIKWWISRVNILLSLRLNFFSFYFLFHNEQDGDLHLVK